MNQDTIIAISAMNTAYGFGIVSYHYELVPLQYAIVVGVIGIIGWVYAYQPWGRSNEHLTEWNQ